MCSSLQFFCPTPTKVPLLFLVTTLTISHLGNYLCQAWKWHLSCGGNGLLQYSFDSLKGDFVVRITGIKLSILALVLVAALAMVPAASATSLNIVVGTTTVGTITLTQGGTCGGAGTIASTSVCVDVSMISGTQVRAGGPVIGFSGNVNNGGATALSFDSTGVLSIKTNGACGGIGSPTICLQGTANWSSLTPILPPG